VGVNPEAIGTLHLLVYKSAGRLPVRDARSPTQRYPEQAKPIVDQGPFLHGNRLWREDSEAQLGRGDTLEVCCVGEEGEHSLGRQRQVYRGSENVERQANYCSRSRTTASLLVFDHTKQTISSNGWEQTVTDVIENACWRVADRAADYLSVDREVCRRAFHRETEERVREVARRILSSAIPRTWPYSSATRQHRAGSFRRKGWPL
jgi:hypothetical protein